MILHPQKSVDQTNVTHSEYLSVNRYYVELGSWVLKTPTLFSYPEPGELSIVVS